MIGGTKERGWVSKPRGSEKAPGGWNPGLWGGEQLAALGSLSVRGGDLCQVGNTASCDQRLLLGKEHEGWAQGWPADS